MLIRFLGTVWFSRRFRGMMSCLEAMSRSCIPARKGIWPGSVGCGCGQRPRQALVLAVSVRIGIVCLRRATAQADRQPLFRHGPRRRDMDGSGRQQTACCSVRTHSIQCRVSVTVFRSYAVVEDKEATCKTAGA